MTTKVISNKPIWVNAYDFSSSMHEVAVDYASEEKEATTLADTTHIFKNGLKSVGLAMNGFWDETTTNPVDSQNFAQTGQNSLCTFAAETGAEGEIAYFMNALQAKYDLTGDIGEMFAFTVDAAAAGSLVRGTIELKQSALTATANSTGRQLGALSATQTLWAAIHVTGVGSGAQTFDAIVQSDDNGSFTSATSRITFTQLTDIGSELKSVVGAVTDDYWRINYTITGSTPSFTVVVVLGILNT